jgi:hypothetical protein
MRSEVRAVLAMTALWLAISPVLAQSAPVTRRSDAAPAAKAQPDKAPSDKASTLSPGANSYSEGQARDLLTAQGYSDVSALVNDSQGIWRGSATSGGKRMRVSIDFKGKISAQPE